EIEEVRPDGVDRPVPAAAVDVEHDDGPAVAADLPQRGPDGEAPRPRVVPGAAQPLAPQDRGPEHELLTAGGVLEQEPLVPHVAQPAAHAAPATQVDHELTFSGAVDPLAESHPGTFAAGALGDLRVQLEAGAGSELPLEVLEQPVPAHAVSLR